jgi:hypothetical protein
MLLIRAIAMLKKRGTGYYSEVNNKTVYHAASFNGTCLGFFEVDQPGLPRASAVLHFDSLNSLGDAARSSFTGKSLTASIDWALKQKKGTDMPGSVKTKVIKPKKVKSRGWKEVKVKFQLVSPTLGDLHTLANALLANFEVTKLSQSNTGLIYLLANLRLNDKTRNQPIFKVKDE